MKNRIQFILAAFLTLSSFLTNVSYANNVPNTNEPKSDITNTYFLSEVAEIVAFLAHPTSEIYDIDISSNSSYGIIEVEYISAWTGDHYDAKFKIRYGSGGFIKDVGVIYDEAFWPAFKATTIVKEIIEDFIVEDADSVYEAKSKVENYIDKQLDEFNGQDLCLFLLNCISLGSNY